MEQPNSTSSPSPLAAEMESITDDELYAVLGAIKGAAAPPEGLLPAQAMVMHAVTHALSGREIDPYSVPVVSPEELAARIADKGDEFRHRVVRYMSLNSLLVDPPPADAIDRADAYAIAMGLGAVCHRLMVGTSDAQEGAILHDFERNGYSQEFLGDGDASVLHADGDDLGDGWKVITDDPKLAHRWDSLADCPAGSLGQNVHDFYKSRAFVSPGRPDSAPPLLAQHDWVHVLADYGTKVECEIEVFGLIAESDDDPRGFALLAMVIDLFVTGNLESAAGIFEADKGHLDESVAIRLGDALKRGMLCTKPDGTRRGGLLSTDWFAYKDVPVDEMRRLCNITPKSADAIEAGSPSTWSLAGLSEYQLAHCNLQVFADHAAPAPD